MLPSHKFHEPGKPEEEDQRPLVRYLRHLQRTDPVLEMQTLQRSLQGSQHPMLTAYLNPFFWMCHMETNETFGRHMVADQGVPEGKILGMEHPILFVTEDKDRCAECDRLLAGDAVRCEHTNTDHMTSTNSTEEACPLVFCSNKCREWAWEHYHKVQDHQALGMLYSQGRGSPQFIYALFVMKALSMIQLPEPNQYALSYITAFIQNRHLLDRAEKFKDSFADAWTGQVKIASGFKCTKNNEGEKYDFDFLLAKLFALRELYAFACDGSSYLFGPSCCINHSCEPNVVIGSLHVDDDCKNHKFRPYGNIEALRPLKKGEQLFYNYRGDSMTPQSTRKANIKAQYGFECHCRLCNDGIPRCDYEGCRAEAQDFQLKRCAKCQSAVYCNRSCQIKDWKHHKTYCGLKAAGKCH